MSNKKIIKPIFFTVLLGSVLVEDVSMLMKHSGEHEKPLHVPETVHVRGVELPVLSYLGGTTVYVGVSIVR